MASYARRLACVFLLGLSFHYVGRAQTVALSAAAASGQPGNAATFNMSLATSAGAQPTAMQWTLGYSPADVSSISATAAGTAATAAKTVTCANKGTGTVTCVLYGTCLLYTSRCV